MSALHPTDRYLSWGRVARGRQCVGRPRFADEVPGMLEESRAAGLSALAVGLGRSYGDSGLNLGQAAIDMSGLDRVLAFDPDTGVLRAQAGLSLGEIMRRMAPLGWFPATTPGTRFVTLGGAVANDVHGKNHHRAGTFGASVRRLGLLRSDLGEIEAAPGDETGLFEATIGGLGLTGIILWAEIQLVRIGGTKLESQSLAFSNCDEFLALARESEAGFEHTVAWVDCSARGSRLGRGVFTRSNWREDGVLAVHDDRQRLSLPADPPGFALNPITLPMINQGFYRLFTARLGKRIEPYASVLFPLDSISGWNRFYGKRGFYQYQCVTPMAAGAAPIAELLAAIAASGQGSFLVVLKTFGAKVSPGLMSFPMPGLTLAVDFSNKGEETLALLTRLDEIVAAAGGRLYPAKDGRMPRSMFEAGYPNLETFTGRIDPALSSSFWRRMHND